MQHQVFVYAIMHATTAQSKLDYDVSMQCTEKLQSTVYANKNSYSGKFHQVFSSRSSKIKLTDSHYLINSHIRSRYIRN